MKMIAGLLRFSIVLISLDTGQAIKEFNLFHHCDKLISMIRNDIKGALLYYIDDSHYSDGKNPCIVELWGWFENDVAMHFRYLSWTMNTHIEIRQGDDWETARPIAGLPKILNSSSFNQLNKVYTSDWLGIFIAIHNPPSRYGPRLFELALNVFHTGRCEKWEYSCDNGWCIDDDLKCNGYNPCSDGSDCQEAGMSKGVIAVVCVSTITGASCILAIVYQVFKHYRKKRRRLQTNNRFQEEADITNYYSWSRQNDQHHNNHADTDHSNGYQVHSRLNANNNASMSNLFGDDHSSRSHRTNQMEPPNYNSIISNTDSSNNRTDISYQEDGPGNSNNIPDPPDYNTAVTWAGSPDRLETQPSAPRLDAEPSAPRLEPESSVPNQSRQEETSDLPSYNDVLQNEEAYRVGDRTVVYRV